MSFFLFSSTAGPPGGAGGMDMSALAGMMGGNDQKELLCRINGAFVGVTEFMLRM